MYVSTGFTPTAQIFTNTSWGPGWGSGTSSSFIISGGPNSGCESFHGYLPSCQKTPSELRNMDCLSSISVLFDSSTGGKLF